MTGTETMLADIFLVAVAGGLILLDRTAAFQFMVSRPIVIGPVIGLLLGQPAAGAILGGLIELLWISRPPLGGHIPPNEAFGVVVSAGAVMIVSGASGDVSRGMLVLGFLMVQPLARLATRVEMRIRRVNNRLLFLARGALDHGRMDSLPRYNLAGLAISFSTWFVCILVLLPISVLLLRFVIPIIPQILWEALEMLYIFLPLVGVAAAVGYITVRRNFMAFGLCYVAALVLLCI